mmetsp:Transcript_43/g.89  ORF Transcript_43/g.89 Transcript_43/m.89 type:complete len:480 (+) Transcript_43:53-1492(+)|eukprot:CAMPEP_0117751354 /NCGR_PEP_ID=MMETSP0947-20121206/10922_1 /TAXON_ID=44440 /ORGANISM="Chattonella subsalsa, Strain CCMP2191" /LENGTH=479 /DNA_ID=CAMNT_0005569713 /DNA_START=31 /DNA_END=1470 /DNA_ORIENTATION=+
MLDIGMIALIGLSVVLGGVIALIFLSFRPKNAPPSAKLGAPVVGNIMAFIKSPLGAIKTCYEKYGPVYTMPMLGKNLTFLIGPEAQAPFFRLKDNELSQNEVYGFMKPVFGPNVVYDAEPKKRNYHMQQMANGLRAARLKSYIPKIIKETNEYLASWGDSGEVDLLDALSELTILTASRCLHGDDVRETLFAEVSRLYHDLDKGITPISFFLPNIPIKAHLKRNKARKEMIALFSKVIADRREKPEEASKNTDILQIFMDMVYKDGTRPSDEEITGLLIALLFAGQHTSSITSTWTSLYLIQNKELLERAVKEMTSVVGNKEVFDFDEIQKMDFLTNSIREALRLQPPLIMLMRYAKKDLSITVQNKDYVIPKGDIVFTSPAVGHRLPDVFDKPDEYDPDRYAEGREEHKQPFAFLGFGGGMHACMGQNFGYMQVKTILTVLLRQYDFELIDKFPEADYTAMVVGPKEGTCKVRYSKKK